MTPQPSTAKASVRANNPADDGCGFDLYRLDCAVDALKGQTLSQSDRAELARISLNIIDLMETYDGHAH